MNDMALVLIILLALNLVLVIALLGIVSRQRHELRESTIKQEMLLKDAAVKPADVQVAVSSAWTSSGLLEKVGKLESYVAQVKDTHTSLEQMLRVPKERAYLGELALEAILADQLPPGMYGIRKSIFNGKIPDAHIKSSNGIICIDSKFALDNYRNMAVTEDPSVKKQHRDQFIRDLQGHLQKIQRDYVRPEFGAEVAFAYIPSEAVYWFMVTELYDTLLKFSKEGVQVVSPLTLAHKVQLIKVGVESKYLSEKADEVRQDILKIRKAFFEIDEEWGVLMRHIRNAYSKSQSVDSAYTTLREEFNQATRILSDRV